MTCCGFPEKAKGAEAEHLEQEPRLVAVVALLTLLIVIVVSMIVVRVATVALTLTGLSSELARFQARSAFTGAGFTTTESEDVVRHPVRRRIILLLMLLGNAGLVTVMSSLILSFVNIGETAGIIGSVWFRLAVLVISLTALWALTWSRWLDQRLGRFVGWALKRWTDLELRDYTGLLHLAGDYVVVELQVKPGDWMAGRGLGELELSQEGVLVLGIEKQDGTYLGAPRGNTRLDPGDTAILYGRQSDLASLDQRRADSRGDRDHQKAVQEQMQIEADNEAAKDDQATRSGTSPPGP